MFLYLFCRDGPTALFETWCYHDGLTYGCYDLLTGVLSSLSKVDLFNGSLPVEPSGDMCLINEDPEQYTYNQWFGGKWEKYTSAPHPLKSFPDMFIVCKDLKVKAKESAVVKSTLGEKPCIKTPHHKRPIIQTSDAAARLPGIDSFLNPDKETERKDIVRAKKDVAKQYFNDSNMTSLYPNLFRILWQSTLPCFKVKYHKITPFFAILFNPLPISGRGQG